MSLFETILREKKEHTLGVCIPEHARDKQQQINETIRRAISNQEFEEQKKARIEVTKKKSGGIKGSFRVSGIFQLAGSVMLTGKVERGFISNKMKSEFLGKRLKTKEINIKHKPVKKIHKNDEGAIFVDRVIVGLKIGDLIEFW